MRLVFWLLAALLVLPNFSDMNAAEKNKKKKKGTEVALPAPKKQSPYEKLFKGKKHEAIN